MFIRRKANKKKNKADKKAAEPQVPPMCCRYCCPLHECALSASTVRVCVFDVVFCIGGGWVTVSSLDG